LGHPENYIRANPMSTPEHIVPEWYFLPFYAILRAMPDKVLGIILLFSSIIILFIIPYIWEGYEPAEFIFFNRCILFLWIINIFFFSFYWNDANRISF